MDNKVISLIINIAVAVIAIVGVYLIITAMGNTAEIDPETQQATADTSTVSNAVNFSLITLIITLSAIAIFTIVAIITNPKRFIPTAIGIVAFGILVLIGYSMVTIETSGPITRLEEATESNLLWGGIGIKTTYVLLTVAIGLIIVQGVRGLIGYFTAK